MRFTSGQQVQVIDSDCRQLHGKTVTVIGNNPKRTAEYEVKTSGGNIWNIHGCFLKPLQERDRCRACEGEGYLPDPLRECEYCKNSGTIECVATANRAKQHHPTGKQSVQIVEKS